MQRGDPLRLNLNQPLVNISGSISRSILLLSFSLSSLPANEEYISASNTPTRSNTTTLTRTMGGQQRPDQGRTLTRGRSDLASVLSLSSLLVHGRRKHEASAQCEARVASRCLQRGPFLDRSGCPFRERPSLRCHCYRSALVSACVGSD